MPAALATVLTLVIVLFSTGPAAAGTATADPQPIPLVPLAQAKEALSKVLSLAAPPKADRPRKDASGVLPRRDLSMALRDLYLARPSLTGTERARADKILARPASLFRSGASGSEQSDRTTTDSRSTSHFEIRYTVGGTNGVSAADVDGNGTPDYVDTIGRTMESVWYTEVHTLGYRAPLMPASGKLVVELSDLGSQGLYGYCAPVSGGLRAVAECGLDNNFDPRQYGAPAYNSLRVTAAHEFFHAIQFNYDTGEDLWFMEGTAVWMEDQVYDGINDYLNYLPYSALAQPQVPADSSSGFNVYGSVLFWIFFAERTKDPAIVKEIWTNAQSGGLGNLYSLQALNKAIAAHGFGSVSLLSLWGTWNTQLGAGYSEAASYPAQKMWQSLTMGANARDSGTKFIRISHLANAYINIKPGPNPIANQKLRVTVDMPHLAAGLRAYTQILRNDGSVTAYTVPLNADGNGTVIVGFNPASIHQAVIVLANASTSMKSCNTGRPYSCDGVGTSDNAPVTVRAQIVN